MRELILFITDKCNLRCNYCPVKKGNNKMSWTVAKKSIDYYLGQDGQSKHIRFFGGEPFLEFKKVKKIVDYAEALADKKSLLLSFDITTNGTLLNNKILNWLKGQNNIELVVSLDGKEIDHLKNRQIFENSLDSYQKIINNLNQLLDLPNVSVNMVVASNQVNNFAKNFLFLLDLGFRKINLLPAYYTFWSEQALAVLVKQFAIVRKIVKIYDRSRKHPYLVIKNTDVVNETALFNNQLVVDWNGNIYGNNLVFTTYFSKFKKKLKLGSVNSLQIDNKKFDYNHLIKKVLPRGIYQSTKRVDQVLTDFITQIKKEKKSQAKSMYSIDIQSGHCLFKCNFCARKDVGGAPFWKIPELPRTINIEDKSLDKFLKESAVSKEINIYGRCAIEKNILNLTELIKKVRNYGFKKIILWTNGTDLGERNLIKKLRSAGLTDLELPIYGYNNKIHDKITGVKGSFLSLEKSLKSLKNSGLKINLHTILLKDNCQSFKKLAEYLINFKINKLSVFLYMSDGSFNYKEENVYKKYCPKMTEIFAGLKTYKKEILPICFAVWPICIKNRLKKYFINIVDDSHVNEIWRLEWRNDQFVSNHQDLPNTFASGKCLSCRLKENCPGIDLSYYNLYGDDEISSL